MTHLGELLDLDHLEQMIKEEYVTRKRHPVHPISIYTYTHKAQGLKVWNEATIRCRGLVVDDVTGEIVAWPFPKFFQYGEHVSERCGYAGPLPDEPFEIFDKLDGSLAIVFHYAGQWLVASKASFISEHAQWAQKRIDGMFQYGDHQRRYPVSAFLQPGNTYLTEIIHPTNKIVVDYGGEQSLSLLAVYDPFGVEIPVDIRIKADWSPIGPVVRSWDEGSITLQEIAQLAESNLDFAEEDVSGGDREGFVIRFRSGVRVKVKYADYMRLHRIMTEVSERDIWRSLCIELHPQASAKELGWTLQCSEKFVEETRAGGKRSKAMHKIMERVPDEFFAWVTGVCDRLASRAIAMDKALQCAYETYLHLADDRKAFVAAAAQWHPTVRSGMMLKLDRQSTSLYIWRQLMPEATVPFREDEEG